MFRLGPGFRTGKGLALLLLLIDAHRPGAASLRSAALSWPGLEGFATRSLNPTKACALDQQRLPIPRFFSVVRDAFAARAQSLLQRESALSMYWTGLEGVLLRSLLMMAMGSAAVLAWSSPCTAAPVLPIPIEPASRSDLNRLERDNECRNCILRDVTLREAHLIGADLRGADLRGADLRDSNLEGADLTGAMLINADLRGANLTNTDLSDVDLRDADLRAAVVINAYSPGVKSTGLRYAGADLTGSDLIIGGGD